MIKEAEFTTGDISAVNRQRADERSVHSGIQSESNGCDDGYQEHAEHNKDDAGIASDVKLLDRGIVLIKIDLSRNHRYLRFFLEFASFLVRKRQALGSDCDLVRFTGKELRIDLGEIVQSDALPG